MPGPDDPLPSSSVAETRLPWPAAQQNGLQPTTPCLQSRGGGVRNRPVQCQSARQSPGRPSPNQAERPRTRGVRAMLIWRPCAPFQFTKRGRLESTSNYHSGVNGVNISIPRLVGGPCRLDMGSGRIGPASLKWVGLASSSGPRTEAICPAWLSRRYPKAVSWCAERDSSRPRRGPPPAVSRPRRLGRGCRRRC
jgi:hypothetical protein